MLKSIFSTAILFALMCVFAFVSCAPIPAGGGYSSGGAGGSGSGGNGGGSGGTGGGGKNGAQITISLPSINPSTRALSDAQVSRLMRETVKYRVTFSGEGQTTTREGSGSSYSATFPVGTQVGITVYCVNAAGKDIVRTTTKTITVSSGTNSISFKLSEDGTELQPTPEPTPPEPAPPQSTVRITFEAGYYITNTPGTPSMWNNMAGVTPPQAGDRTVGGSINETMTQNGYTFKGWVVTYNPSATSYNDQNFVTTYPSTAATLIGIWEENAPNTFTLSYNWGANDVQTPVPSAQGNITSGTSVTVEIPQNVTRPGYEFRGWSETQNAQTATYTINNTQIVITQDKVLYAVWSLKQYTINFNPNTPISGSSQASINITIESTEELPSADNGKLTISNTGYDFGGWGDSTQQNVYTIATLIEAIKNGSSNISITADNAITLYAQWTAKKYTVTYESNAPAGSTVTGSMQPTERTYGMDFTFSANSYVVNGYEFTGWYASASGGSSVIESTYKHLADNLTVYAQWRATTSVTIADEIWIYYPMGGNVASDGSFNNGIDDGYGQYTFTKPNVSDVTSGTDFSQEKYNATVQADDGQYEFQFWVLENKSASDVEDIWDEWNNGRNTNADIVKTVTGSITVKAVFYCNE